MSSVTIASWRTTSEPPCQDGYPVSHVEELDPPSSRREWGRADFVIPDFAFINNCAYFDYQRNKVYIRTNPNLKRSQTRRRRKKGKKNLAVNRCVELCSRAMPLLRRERRWRGGKMDGSRD